MTNEQRIRGADATVDWALALTGYSHKVLTEPTQHDTLKEHVTRPGATGTLSMLDQMEYSLNAREIDA